MKHQVMDIGKRIKEVFMQMPKDCTPDWFAKELNCDRRNVYRIFNKQNIDIALLRKISQVLGHDFFQDLSNEVFEPDELSDRI